MKIRPGTDKFFRADRQMDGRTDLAKLIDIYRSVENASENQPLWGNICCLF
jgi:hypothetical protein